ncbi:inactive serine protease 45 [Exaiptasia diaphana]|uniref:Peptidase S1 domain-containing protein n=1 Tax=Exaiptasia diaphana TaxID=2652724 RepID=A0A913XDL6_EXADI|nr:inactive serine protease 45 [Exaiptasia diaphana]KXJ26400.1 Tryptase [Exaiptasia diaphana]
MNSYGEDIYFLTEKITFNDKVKPASLPKQGEEVPVGTQCYVTGVKNNNQFVSEGPFAVVNNATCFANLKGEDKLHQYVRPINKAYTLCTKGQSVEFCKDGFVPGPLTCKMGDKWVLQGINGWSKMSCAMNGYSVFFRVSSIIDHLTRYVPYFMRKYVY